MQLLIEPNEQRAYRGLCDDRPVLLPELRQGGIVPLEIGLVQRIRFPWNGQIFAPLNAPDDFRVAIGMGFLLPLAGDFTILDRSLSYNPTADEIETELNDNADIITAGGVTVTGSAGFFLITWNDTGDQDLLTGDVGNLIPLSILSFREVVAGDGSTRAVQSLRIFQNAGAVATIEDASEASAIDLQTIHAGGAGVNTQVRVFFSEDVYAGTWVLSADGTDSDPLDFGWTAARLQVALEALSTIGSGNVIVKQEGEGQFLITFVGDLAGTAVEVTVAGSGLLALELLSGVLDLRAQGVDLLLAGNDSLVTTLEIQSETNDGPRKVFDADVLLSGGIIENGTTDSEVIEPSASEVETVEVLVTGDLIGADTIPVSFTGLTSAPTIIGTPYFVKGDADEENVAVGSLDSITSHGMNVNLLSLAVAGQTLRVSYIP